MAPHQAGHVVELVAHLSGGSRGKHPAIQNDDVVVTVEGTAPVVAAHQKGLTGAGLLAHHPEKVLTAGGIDGTAGFIKQQDVALLHQGSGQQHPLLLATGELIETPPPHLPHSDPLKQGLGRRCAMAFGLSKPDHVPHGDGKGPVDGCLLGHQANAAAAFKGSSRRLEAAMQQMQKR